MHALETVLCTIISTVTVKPLTFIRHNSQRHKSNLLTIIRSQMSEASASSTPISLIDMSDNMRLIRLDKDLLCLQITALGKYSTKSTHNKVVRHTFSIVADSAEDDPPPTPTVSGACHVMMSNRGLVTTDRSQQVTYYPEGILLRRNKKPFTVSEQVQSIKSSVESFHPDLSASKFGMFTGKKFGVVMACFRRPDTPGHAITYNIRIKLNAPSDKTYSLIPKFIKKQTNKVSHSDGCGQSSTETNPAPSFVTSADSLSSVSNQYADIEPQDDDIDAETFFSNSAAYDAAGRSDFPSPDTASRLRSHHHYHQDTTLSAVSDDIDSLSEQLACDNFSVNNSRNNLHSELVIEARCLSMQQMSQVIEYVRLLKANTARTSSTSDIPDTHLQMSISNALDSAVSTNFPSCVPSYTISDTSTPPSFHDLSERDVTLSTSYTSVIPISPNSMHVDDDAIDDTVSKKRRRSDTNISRYQWLSSATKDHVDSLPTEAIAELIQYAQEHPNYNWARDHSMMTVQGRIDALKTDIIEKCSLCQIIRPNVNFICRKCLYKLKQGYAKKDEFKGCSKVFELLKIITMVHISNSNSWAMLYKFKGGYRGIDCQIITMDDDETFRFGEHHSGWMSLSTVPSLIKPIILPRPSCDRADDEIHLVEMSQYANSLLSPQQKDCQYNQIEEMKSCN